MQVRKFEAKTMKEALQMVKLELGPDAIILSAKDNKKSFGLVGRGSIEITAAISEKSLLKKQYVDRNIPENSKERFNTQTAKTQKLYIEDAVARRARSAQRPDPRIGQGAVATRPPTSQRYIDIHDLDSTPRGVGLDGRRVEDLLSELSMSGHTMVETPVTNTYSRPAVSITTSAPVSPAMAHDEVISLRREVDALRDLLSQFQGHRGKQPMTQHPGADYGLPFELSAIYEKLHVAGVDTKFIVEILEKANEELTPTEKKKVTLVDAWVARYILSHTSVTGSWSNNSSTAQVHLFVGPAATGKTSALIKMASQLVMQDRKKVVIVAADTFKVGAAEQLRTYSQILDLPFEILHSNLEYSQLMRKYSAYDYILVDLPGMTLKDISEIDQIRTLLPQREIPKQTHLVLNCTAKEIDAYEACNRYQITHFDDILVTKLDETNAHGFLFNIQKKTEKCLYAFGIGQKIPEDIELATRERVLDLIYKITKK
jgi:flagellar biosynthesis protein FlhF